jgi:hypothetical protein
MGGYMAGTDAIYVKQLSEVLRKRDVEELRAFLRSESEAREQSTSAEIDSITNEDLQIRMYKMIIARPELGDIHADARRWLREHDIEVRF